MKLNLEQIESVCQGAVRVVQEDKYIRMYRFSEGQEKVYKEQKNESMYIKTYSTAGIKLMFKTDSTKLFFKVDVEFSSSRKYFSHDIFVTGKMIGNLDNFSDFVMPEGYTGVDLPVGEFSKEFSLGEGEKTVCIYFPWSVTSKIMELSIDDGAFVESVKPAKKMITFGDSITHGYDALRPSDRYAGRIAEALGAEEINKAIGGEIFFPALAESKDDFEPDYITVAYGTNDWSHHDAESFNKNCRGFYKALSENYPNAKIFAITPIWRKDCDEDKPMGDFMNVDKYIKELTADLDNVICITGLDFIPKEEKYFADFRLHPNDVGFDFYFENLYKQIKLYI